MTQTQAVNLAEAQGTLQFGLRAEHRAKLQENIDGVTAPAVFREGHLPVIEQTRPLARVAAPGLFIGARAPGHQPGPEQPLEVEHVVELGHPHLAHQAQEGENPVVPPEHVHLVDAIARPDDRRKDVAHDPGNSQLRALHLQRRDDLQSVHDVTEGGRFDDEKFRHGRALRRANLLLTAAAYRLIKIPLQNQTLIPRSCLNFC